MKKKKEREISPAYVILLRHLNRGMCNINLSFRRHRLGKKDPSPILNFLFIS